MSEKTLRVRQELVDQLLDIVGDVVSNTMEVDLLDKALRDNKTASLANGLSLSLKDISVAGKKTSDELVRAIMEIRMEPMGALFGRFHSMVRSLSRDQGKKVDFQVEGEDVLADRTVGEKMADPLVHILRNSVDHGIEPFEERVDLGKPEMGKIVLSAESDDENLYIKITDDGRGLNIARIREKAVSMGLVSDIKARLMSDDELSLFIFHPGFSTAEKVTDISGRGVGMDVVSRNVTELKADIKITSKPGQGTKITIAIPRFRLVDIIDAMVMRVDNRFFGIPVKSVLRVISFPKSGLHFLKDRPFVNQADEMIPLYKVDEILEDVFETNWDAGDADTINFIVLGMQGMRVGLVFDQVLNMQRVVIKKAEALLDKVKEILGVAGIGSGKMAAIINPEYVLLKHIGKERGGKDAPVDHASIAAAAEAAASDIAEVEDSVSDKKRIEDALGADELASLDDIMADVQEHLFNINNDIKMLEVSPGKELFERLFRAFHSLKGAFGALKLVALVDITNEGEDLLHMLRESRIEIDEELVSLMFKLADVVDVAVAELRNGFYPYIPVEELHNMFTEYKEKVAPAQQGGLATEDLDVPRDAKFNLNFLDHLKLQKSLSWDMPIYEIYIQVADDVIMQSVRAVVLITAIFHRGNVIATMPSPAFLEQSEDYRAIKILYQSDQTPEEIKKMFVGEELVALCEVSLCDRENLM